MIVVPTGFPLNRRMRKLREHGELMFEDEYYGKQGTPDLSDKDSPAKKDIIPRKVMPREGMPREANMSPRDRERLQFARDRYHKIFSGLKRVINAQDAKEIYRFAKKAKRAGMHATLREFGINPDEIDINPDGNARSLNSPEAAEQPKETISPVAAGNDEALATKECFPQLPDELPSVGEENGNAPVATYERPIRPEQRQFRDNLIRAYGGCCAVTGASIDAVLDAAHLPGRDYKLGHNSACDGILLRADLHRLLDTGLMAFTAKGIIQISREAGAEYRKLHGQTIRFPKRKSDHPTL